MLNLSILGLSREGTSWCESLNQEFTCWPAIRTHLKKNYKVMFEQFAGLEAMDESKISDIRLARKAGGFAFEHWCRGGDIKDINKLVGCFDTMLENESPNDMDELEVRTKKRVVQHITQNAAKALRKDTKVNVWELPLTARKELLSKWKEEVNPWVIIDQTVEIHRRHQVAAAKKKQIQHQIEARCLEKRRLSALLQVFFR